MNAVTLPRPVKSAIVSHPGPMLRIESGPTSIAGVEVDAIVGSVCRFNAYCIGPTILWAIILSLALINSGVGRPTIL
jgi:hypothetical protein